MASDDNDKGLSTERKKALNLAISQIEKQLGKGAIMRMGSENPREAVPAIPTGAMNLDVATGIGGIPAGVSPRSTALSRPARPR